MLDKVEYQKKHATKLGQFVGSTWDAKVKSRNPSNNRSQIFYAERQDSFADRRLSKASLQGYGAKNKSSISFTNDEANQTM